MSKHRHYRPAENFSRDFDKAPVEETVETEVEVVEEVVEPEVPVQETKLGVVTGCQKLNVRAEASANATVLGTIDDNTEVEVNEVESTEDFYKICTTAGVEGFCMKKFISVKQ